MKHGGVFPLITMLSVRRALPASQEAVRALASLAPAHAGGAVKHWIRWCQGRDLKPLREAVTDASPHDAHTFSFKPDGTPGTTTKGEEASLTQQREVLRNSPMPPDQSAPATAPPSPPPLMAGGSLAQLPGVEAARVAKPPPKPLLSDRPSDMGSPLVEDEYTDRSLGYSGEASWSPSN